MPVVNLMIIGVGAHSKRIYLPTLFKHAKSRQIQLKLGVDLITKKTETERYLKKNKFDLPMLYVDKHQQKQPLSKLVKKLGITGVVISTDPLAHKEYALWAISQGLHVLMDKPITTRINAAHELSAARGITQDYQDILRAYIKQQHKKPTIFSVNVQRRYELGYQKVFGLINEVSNRFNAPVTSIQAMHSDGVWIFPDEVVDQQYHPYNLGFGKGSHSGYHIFDIAWQFYQSGLIAKKTPDTAEVYSSFLNPDGLLIQFNQNDYKKYFGSKASSTHHNHSDLINSYKSFGEIDIFSNIKLLKKNINICNISINLLHNSFSRRAWFKANEDLYKGNGRVKHQYYNIQQGPFQCIQIHNYQSNDIHAVNTIADYKLGGNNHFDVYVFRNSAMFGKKEQALKIYNLKDLDENEEFQDTRLYNETTKERVILEFVDFIKGKIKLSSMKSNLPSHQVPVKIMSAIYESNVKSEQGKNPIATFKL